MEQQIEGFCIHCRKSRSVFFFIKGDLDLDNLTLQSSILPIVGSKHFLDRIDIFEPQKSVRNLFKCEKMWFLDSSFLGYIKDWWSLGKFEGSKMFIFVSKMKMLKEKILRWNKEHFKNIFKEKLDVENRLKELDQEIIKYGMNNDSYLLEKELLAKQEDILSKEEIFLETKSRDRWLMEGDWNTKYVHNSTLYNRAKSRIASIRNQRGILIDNPKEIAEIFVDHF